jgi:hypothetical protein
MICLRPVTQHLFIPLVAHFIISERYLFYLLVFMIDIARSRSLIFNHILMTVKTVTWHLTSLILDTNLPSFLIFTHLYNRTAPHHYLKRTQILIIPNIFDLFCITGLILLRLSEMRHQRGREGEGLF